MVALSSSFALDSQKRLIQMFFTHNNSDEIVLRSFRILYKLTVYINKNKQ